MCKTAFAVAVLVASSSVMAGEKVDLSVIGEITPGGCMPSFSGNGLIAYGDIDPAFLNRSYKPLPAHSIDILINCSAATKVALKPQSMRLGSAAGGAAEDAGGFGRSPINALGSTETYVTGLNFDGGGNKVGGLIMNMKQGKTTIDGLTTVDVLEVQEDGSLIKKPDTRSLKGLSYTWGTAGDVLPLPITTLSTSMDVQAYMGRIHELDLSKEINLDGLVTFELVYL